MDTRKVDAYIARIEHEGIEAVLDAAAYGPDHEAPTVAEYRTMLRRLVDAGLMAVCATTGCGVAFVPRSKRQRFHSVECRLRARQSARTRRSRRPLQGRIAPGSCPRL